MIEEAQIGTAQMLYYSNNEQTPQMIIFEKIPHTLLLLLSFDNIYSVSPKVDLEVSNHRKQQQRICVLFFLEEP